VVPLAAFGHVVGCHTHGTPDLQAKN